MDIKEAIKIQGSPDDQMASNCGNEIIIFTPEQHYFAILLLLFFGSLFQVPDHGWFHIDPVIPCQ